MKTYSKRLFLFSLLSFVGVLVFGMIRSLDAFKALLDANAFQNVMLFHSHFDQLCWLGSAAIGAAFYALGDSYRGSVSAVRHFCFAYIAGTLLFSLAFLARAIGYISKAFFLQSPVFIVMVSLGSLFFVAALVNAVVILAGLLRRSEPRNQSAVFHKPGLRE